MLLRSRNLFCKWGYTTLYVYGAQFKPIILQGAQGQQICMFLNKTVHVLVARTK